MKHSIRKVILNPITMLFCGLLLGILSRLFDMYTQILGDVFSQMAIWILFGTLIAIYSKTRIYAMINILPFCLGMLATYYITAMLMKDTAVWSLNRTVINGWIVFALLSPLMALIAWQTKEKGVFPKILGVGIVSSSFLSGIVIFDGPSLADLIINGILIFFIFIKKIKR